MRLQEPVVGGPVEEVECDVGIGLRRNLPSLDGSFDHDPVLSPDREYEAFTPDLGQFGIPLHFRDESNERATGHRTFDHTDPRT